MARKPRIVFEGAIYHVTVRGVERRPIFKDVEDRERFLVQLADSVEQYGARLYLYCLMPNHVHLLIETPNGNLSAFMQRLQTAYTVYFNRRHRRAGHLMQGRFGAQLVQGDAYMLNLSRYIHLNPIFVGSLANRPMRERIRVLRQYRWSSYRGYVGLAKRDAYVDYAPILASVPGAQRDREKAYRRFVESGVAHTDEEFLDVLKGAQWGIGDGAFRERVKRMHADGVVARQKEDVSFRRSGARRSPDFVVAAVSKVFGVKVEALRKRTYGDPVRAVAMRALVQYAGLNQREVADHLRVGTGSAVCRALARLAGRLPADRALEMRVGEIDALMAG